MQVQLPEFSKMVQSHLGLPSGSTEALPAFVQPATATYPCGAKYPGSAENNPAVRAITETSAVRGNHLLFVLM
jgi:hypothetical protein